MSSVVEKKLNEPKFTLISVEKTETPPGCDGQGWYRYVIGRGTSTIVGSRRGTLSQIRAYASEYAEEINQRAANGGASTWSPKHKGRKAAPRSA
ncbi:MAG: hypothetical protein HYY48_08955 [Gammaproteobacteria bacterium]|nr:hypothetical protein [Gammaproteobacteria bacterium]